MFFGARNAYINDGGWRVKGGGAGKKGGEEKEWSGVEWYSLGRYVEGSVEGLVGIAC